MGGYVGVCTPLYSPIQIMRVRRKNLSILLTDLVVWPVAMVFYILLRFAGINDIPFLQVEEKFNLKLLLPITIMGGVLVGVIYGMVDILLSKPWLQKRSFGAILFIKGVIHLVVILAISVVVRLQAFDVLEIERTIDNLKAALLGPDLIMLLLYTTAISFLLNFGRQIDQRFGPGNLWRFLQGKFHKPVQEPRIFMFLDLRGSTSLAEDLGHIKFSQMLQDCFNDLSVVRQRMAEVYQYVGDEAILTWELDRGLLNCNCLWAFYDFKSALNQKASYYRSKYGVMPEFKAGLNAGKVTATEIGSIKREIAYHGDTLNTAARIQEQCNQFKEEVLISSALEEKLPDCPGLERQNLGFFNLKGKQQTIEIYSVEQVLVDHSALTRK